MSGTRIRVLVCDDSFTIRSIIARILGSDPEIEVAGLAADGAKAAEALRAGNIDVVVLDVEMPVMDGLTALPLLLRIDPGVRIIMASALTTQGGAITMRALAAGAADYVPKPAAAQADEFAREILTKVKGQARLRRLGAAIGRLPAAPPPTLTLQPQPARTPLLLAIGSSTGGPQALFAFFRALAAPLPVPIVVTQHMPPLFTRSLAEHIERQGPRSCREAGDRQPLLPDHILIAPGDRHMTIMATEAGLRIRLTDDPPENSCRPAVDPMLRSAAVACQGRVLAVILTGMGQDGLRGGKAVLDAGGSILAQDEASSVVWGMPGAVARAGLCHAVLPIDELARKVSSMMRAR
ncbi:protein-glutamate methylesterase/protein-glutamine glutaminase [Lichenicoccus sp.]|uniref:protein-glutamate methylesterase/protein-glutamine glutaminase n=1 Tax=Lichenicoccus sp. TaxID=2781899 RepID=UPI003D0E08B8